MLPTARSSINFLQTKVRAFLSKRFQFNFDFSLSALFYSLLISITAILTIAPLTVNAALLVAPTEEKTVSNGWFAYSAQPGQTLQDSIKITNTGLSEALVRISPHDLSVSDQGAFSVKTDSQTNEQVGTWISLLQSEIVIPAQQSVNVPFSITIPDTAKDGEYAGGITAHIVSEAQNPVKVVVRQGARIYITVHANSENALQEKTNGQDDTSNSSLNLNTLINQFELVDVTGNEFKELSQAKPFIGKDMMAVRLKATNTGNIFANFEAIVKVRNQNGKVIEKRISQELIPDNQERTYYFPLNAAYSSGQLNSELTYSVTPLIPSTKDSALSKASIDGILTHQLTVDSASLKDAPSAIQPLLNEPQNQPELVSSSNSQEKIRSILISAIIVIILLGTVGAVVFLIYKRQKIKTEGK